MTIYIAGEAVSDYREFTDQAGANYDPVGLLIDILDPDGVVIDADLDSYQSSETGKYYFVYTVPTGYDYIVINWKTVSTTPVIELVLHQTVVSIYDIDRLFCSLLYADNYANMKLNTTWLALSRNEKIAYLEQATQFITALPWKGIPVDVDQTTVFPRYMYDKRLSNDLLVPESSRYPYNANRYRGLYNTTVELPDAVKKACCEVAFMNLKEVDNVHIQNQELGIKSVSIGDQSVSYSGSRKDMFLPVNITQLLKPYVFFNGRII